MQRASYFYLDKGLFGSYPTEEGVRELEEVGVRYFINLTCPEETLITPYRTEYHQITYPIVDRCAPMNRVTFAKFLTQLLHLIRQLPSGEKVYIHCKGGHGRAGLVVACLLCKLYAIGPVEALKLTSQCHDARPEMSTRMRKLGSPQTAAQKSFVREFMGRRVFQRGQLSLEEGGQVKYNDKLFESALDALRAHPGHLKAIVHAKFEQNTQSREVLMGHMGPIIYGCSTDPLLGQTFSGVGQNALGIVLERVRESFLEEIDGVEPEEKEE